MSEGSGEGWFTEAEMPAFRDFWVVYESAYDDLQIATQAAVAKHPVFGPMIDNMTPEQLAAQNVESLNMLRRAVAGEWAAYEDNLRTQGMTYVAMGIAFRDWYDVVRVFARHMVPHLVERYGDSPARLVGALQSMQEFLDRAMAILGEAYIESKERLVREGEHRLAEVELHSQKVREASRLKSEFLANMSHELRTPLNAIIGFAELLHDGEVGPVEAKQKEFLADILASGRHLLQLINDVLDLSKVEAGKMQFHPEAFDVRRTLAEVASILRPTASAKQVEIEIVADAIGRVVLDPARFKQILYNYLSNALKFSPPGSTVVVRALDEGEMIRLEVEDSGVGISEADQRQLFTEFRQLESGAAKRHGGTGLGLALTKRLAEAQGGSVGVRSALNVGSTFHVVLPKQAKRSASLRMSAAKGQPTILVIEDDPRDRQAIVDCLGRAGYAIETAATGAEAIARCGERSFDAITLDLLLPDMSGLDVLRAIRTESKNESSPVVVLTVVTEKATAGFIVSDVLAKPVDDATLVEAIRRAGVPSGEVIVIDDDPASRKLASATLARLGHACTCFEDGVSALDSIARSRPSAIILDLLMPGIDGFQVLARLRQSPTHRDIPVIVWTTKDLSADEVRRLRGAAQVVVQKGLGPSHLATALASHVPATGPT